MFSFWSQTRDIRVTLPPPSRSTLPPALFHPDELDSDPKVSAVQAFPPLEVLLLPGSPSGVRMAPHAPALSTAASGRRSPGCVRRRLSLLLPTAQCDASLTPSSWNPVRGPSSNHLQQQIHRSLRATRVLLPWFSTFCSAPPGLHRAPSSREPWTRVTYPSTRPSSSSVCSSFFAIISPCSTVLRPRAPLVPRKEPSPRGAQPLGFWGSRPDQAPHNPLPSNEASFHARKRSVNFHLLPEIAWRKSALPVFAHGLVGVHLDGQGLLGQHSHLFGFGAVPLRHPPTRHFGVRVQVGRRSVQASGSVGRPGLGSAFFVPDGILIVFFFDRSRP